jgi:hypothetical protein
MRRVLLFTAGRIISDHCLVILEGEREENLCVSQVQGLVIIMW